MILNVLRITLSCKKCLVLPCIFKIYFISKLLEVNNCYSPLLTNPFHPQGNRGRRLQHSVSVASLRLPQPRREEPGWTDRGPHRRSRRPWQYPRQADRERLHCQRAGLLRLHAPTRKCTLWSKIWSLRLPQPSREEPEWADCGPHRRSRQPWQSIIFICDN